MSLSFPHIAILGGGLLGGSLALASQGGSASVRLWSRRPDTTLEAMELGITGATSNLVAAVDGADLVVLAVPVGAMPGLLASAILAGLPSSGLVTDVGSVKQTPHATLGPLCRAHGSRFIGSHPMAGSEQGGISAADPAIFRNAACLLTDDDQAGSDVCSSLEAFWQSIGCRTTWMTAADHDTCVARISHAPHVIAAAAALACMENPAWLPYAGGGLRDTTRVAAGNPAMWAEILLENRTAVAPALRDAVSNIEQLLAGMETSDATALTAWLDRAKRRRDALK